MQTLLPKLASPLLAITIGAYAQSPQPKRPDGIQAHRDLSYVVNGHQRQKLDLYVPAAAAGPRPVIIWVHGGGWRSGSKEQCLPLRSGYLERGYAVASIGYRLSQHAPFPAQIEDCKAAIRWLRAHAAEYHLDANRFGAWGGSAGGHLAALLGTSGGVKAFDAGSNLDQSSRVQAVCDFYGPTDLNAMATTAGYESHASANSPESKLLGGPVLESKAAADRANPLTYVSADDPAFLIVHGDKDLVVPPGQSQLLFNALRKAGVSAHLHTIHGAAHGGAGFSSRDIEELVSTFFDERLKGATRRVDALATESTVNPSTASQRDLGAIPGRRREEIAHAQASPSTRPEAYAQPSIRDFELSGEHWTCNADGQSLRGILVKPNGKGPFPAILINHGMGSSADQFGLQKAREFVKWGFVCIATDLTHARPGRDADRSQFGASTENLRRARACIAILRGLPEVDPKKICAYGNSMGAFLTIGLAAEISDQLAAAAITAGGVIPRAGFPAPTTAAAERIRTPFLILHGSPDRAVPTENSAELKRVLDRNKVANERHVFEGIGHNLHAEKSGDVYRLMRTWFTARGILR